MDDKTRPCSSFHDMVPRVRLPGWRMRLRTIWSMSRVKHCWTITLAVRRWWWSLVTRPRLNRNQVADIYAGAWVTGIVLTLLLEPATVLISISVTGRRDEGNPPIPTI